MSKQRAQYIIMLSFTAFLISIDQLLKIIINQNISLGENMTFIPKVFGITYVHNNGAAWNLLNGHMCLLTFITIIAAGVIFYYFWRSMQQSRWLNIALLLMFSGAVSNFIDRIWHGYVIDMFKIEFIDFPVFNMADSYLVVGVCLLMIYTFIIDRKGSPS
ncbi:MAG: signal peptidase II [Streptococcaceae bacterium]|jgi:signal peptidase II|nr:signal peptidase II [Streptococcaceae bacterium]